MTTGPRVQRLYDRNMQLLAVNHLQPGEDIVYFTDPQALLSSKHTGPVLKTGEDDPIHNWSNYLMTYEAWEHKRWYAPAMAWAQLPRPFNEREFYNEYLGEPHVIQQPPSPNEQARQERLAALREIQERRRNALNQLPRIPDREIWMP